MRKLLLVLSVLGSSLCLAQTPTVTLTAAATSGNGQVTPVLTWTTNPPASSCVAGGDWTGNKSASGMETLPVITESATYSLRCTWQGDSSALFKWQNPTVNSDGSPYTNRGHSLIVYDNDPIGGLDFMQVVANPLQASYQFTNLSPPGTWSFAIYAINDLDISSPQSNVVSKVLTANETSEEALSITVNTVPLAPVALSVE